MKTRIINRIGLSLLLMALMTVFLPVTTVLADYYGDLTLNPDQGEIGDLVDIEGDDFVATYTSGEITYDSYISLFFSSEEANLGDEINDEVENYEILRTWLWVDTTGDFDTSFYVPDELTDGDDDETVGGGTYYIYATYTDEGNDIVGVAEFTVIDAEISLNITTGPTGTTVTVTGEEFNENEDITVYYDNIEMDISSGDVETDNDGEFSCVIIIPESITGTHTIKVIDDDESEGEATFTVTPDIALSADSGNNGDTITVTGKGFCESDSVTITFNNTTVASSTTNDDGSFNATFQVPSLTSATYYVVARDDDNNSDETIFSITTKANLSQTTANIGDDITITGKGFQANSSVNIRYGTESVLLAQGTSDSKGAFSIAFKLPTSTHGTQRVIASDGVNSLELIVAIESIAPAAPALLTPLMDEKASQPIYFDWEDVTDPSLPVTYTLEIVAGIDASTVILQKTGLTDSEYTMTKDEKLASPDEENPYYWRVKASDGAGNESAWAAARALDTGFSFTMPTWLMITLGGLGGILIFVAGFVVGRKSSYY